MKKQNKFTPCLFTWEAFSFSVTGTCSTTRGFPSSLHRAARYILGLPRVALEARNSLFLADNALATGLKSRSGTVRKAAILDRSLQGPVSRLGTARCGLGHAAVTHPLHTHYTPHVDDSLYVKWLRKRRQQCFECLNYDDGNPPNLRGETGHR